MTPRVFASFLAVAISATLCAPARADDACWQLVHRAIEASASGAHALYVSYSETQDINEDGNRFEHSSASITYRDDGVAYVDDDRWAHPFTGYILDPGPPVLGPYGDRRHAWLDLIEPQAAALPIIGNARNTPTKACVDQGDDIWQGQALAHIVFPNAPVARPALLEMWIDRKSGRVAHLATRDWLSFWGESGTSLSLVTYLIDVKQVGRYEVLSHISWSYDLKWFDQRSHMVGDYTFGNYAFSQKPPADTSFATIDQ